MSQSTREFKLVDALPEKKRSRHHERMIVALCSRAHDDASWSCPYQEHLRSKKVRSNKRLIKRILKMLTMIAKVGESYYNKNSKDLEDVGEDLWELKPKGHRLLMFKDEQTDAFTKPCWIIVDAFKKPSKSKQRRFIREAKATMRNYFESK